MRLSRALLFTAVLFFAVPTYPQQSQPIGVPPATPARDIQAATVLNQAFGALVGAGTSIADITLTGTARRIAGTADDNGTVVLKALATGEARLDLSLPSGQRSEVHANSAKGPVGSWSGPDGAPKFLPFFNLLVDSAWFSPALMVSKLALSPDTVASGNTPETRNGVAVQHLTVSKQFPKAPALTASFMQHHSQMEIYLDASTLLPVALTFETHPDKDAFRDIPVEINFSNYSVVNGVSMPFHVQQYLNNALILDLQFQSASLNTGLAASAFSVPDQPSSPPVIRAAH